MTNILPPLLLLILVDIIDGITNYGYYSYPIGLQLIVTRSLSKSRSSQDVYKLYIKELRRQYPYVLKNFKSSRWKASSNGNILGDTFCRGDHFINQASNHNRFHHLSQGAVEGDWSWVPLNVGGFLRHSRERRVSGCITVWEFEFVTDFLIDPPEGVSQKEIVRFVFVHVILCRKTMTILSCPSKSS